MTNDVSDSSSTLSESSQKEISEPKEKKLALHKKDVTLYH
jgi:hypothetical protein